MKGPLRIAAIVVLGALIVGAAVAVGMQFGASKVMTEMADRGMVASTQPAIPSVTEPSITPVNDQPSPDEAPYGAEDDGPGPGYDAESDPFNGGENSGCETPSDPASVFGGVYSINLEGDHNCAHGTMELEINMESKETSPYMEPVSVIIRESSGEGHPASNARFTQEGPNALSFIFPFIDLGNERILRGKITSDGRIEGTQTYHDGLSESLGMSGLRDGTGTFSGNKQ